MDVENAALTDVGCRRHRNEDAFFVSDEMKLYVVSDGMGGHRAGDVASRLVVEGMREYIDRVKDRGDGQASAGQAGLSREASHLVDAIGHANRKVWHASRNASDCEGMGATVSAVWISGSSFVAANVGDSPVYCIHGETIEMVSVPHNLSNGKTTNGDKPPEPKGLKNILTRAVGIRERVVADVCESQCYPGDRFVLCSDGLSNRVSEEEILQAARNLSQGGHPNLGGVGQGPGRGRQHYRGGGEGEWAGTGPFIRVDDSGSWQVSARGDERIRRCR